MVSRVFSICDAYESGVGHGHNRDKLPNPWKEGSEEWEAYKIGYDLGEERANAKERCEAFDTLPDDYETGDY